MSLSEGVYVVETQGIPDHLAWSQDAAQKVWPLPVPADAQAEVNACKQ